MRLYFVNPSEFGYCVVSGVVNFIIHNCFCANTGKLNVKNAIFRTIVVYFFIIVV